MNVLSILSDKKKARHSSTGRFEVQFPTISANEKDLGKQQYFLV